MMTYNATRIIMIHGKEYTAREEREVIINRIENAKELGETFITVSGPDGYGFEIAIKQIEALKSGRAI